MSICTACTPPGLRLSTWEVVVVWKDWFLSFYFGQVWWSWKTWSLTSSALGGCGGLERTDPLIVFKDLACKFYMLHGFKEPTMQTSTEAEADCPQNSKSPVGNPDARLPSEPWGGVISRQPWCWTPISELRSHQLCWPLEKHLILVISRPFCTTYFIINTKFYCLYMHLLISPP